MLYTLLFSINRTKAKMLSRDFRHEKRQPIFNNENVQLSLNLWPITVEMGSLDVQRARCEELHSSSTFVYNWQKQQTDII